MKYSVLTTALDKNGQVLDRVEAKCTTFLQANICAKDAFMDLLNNTEERILRVQIVASKEEGE